jgi:hypothetical protein
VFHGSFDRLQGVADPGNLRAGDVMKDSAFPSTAFMPFLTSDDGAEIYYEVHGRDVVCCSPTADSCFSPAWLVGLAVRRPIRMTLFMAWPLAFGVR